MGQITPTDGVFKMNTNGNSNAEPFGRFCYDFTGVVNPNISSDYLAVLGASTFVGRYPVESAYFCGIFDGVNQVFPGIFSKYLLSYTVFENGTKSLTLPQRRHLNFRAKILD